MWSPSKKPSWALNNKYFLQNHFCHLPGCSSERKKKTPHSVNGLFLLLFFLEKRKIITTTTITIEHCINHLTCFVSLDFHKKKNPLLVTISSYILSVSKHHFTNTDHFTNYWSFISISSPILKGTEK